MPRHLILLLLVLATVLTSCHPSPRKATSRMTAAESGELVLVATTDFHAALEKAEAVASIVRGLKQTYGEHMLYLDGGDLFQGSLEGNMPKGKSVVELFNQIGLDAAAIGNHDLDYGPDVAGRTAPKPGEDGLGNLKARVRDAKFKWLSVNFVWDKKRGPYKNARGQSTVFAPHAVFERAGQKACVIGGTTPATQNITNPMFLRGARFVPLEAAVKAEATKLRKSAHCDWVVITVHAGLLCNKNGRCLEEGGYAEILHLLNALPPGTLDAVVAGHTHKRAQEVINGTPVIEAESNGKTVGVVHLTKNGHRFEPYIDVPTDAKADDITALLKSYRDAASVLKKRVVGQSSGAFIRRYDAENPLGNLMVDAIHAAGIDAASADFALTNAGGLRGDLPAGQLTYGDVFGALPFDNSLSVIDIKGSELRRLIEIAQSGGHGISPVSGLHVKRLNVPPGAQGTWSRDLNGDGVREDWERNLTIEITDTHGVPLQDDKIYKLATHDFLVMGGDHQNYVYDKLPTSRKHTFAGIWLRDLIVDYLAKHGEIRPEDFYSPERPRVELISP